jgi:hypothetical protein
MTEGSVRTNLVARVAQLEADLAEARVALKVIDSLRSTGPAKQPGNNRDTQAKERRKTRSDFIREAVDDLQDTFTLHDVIAYVERTSGQAISNRDVVSAMLCNLKESGYIFVVQKGGGGSPSVFRRNRDKPF